VRSVGQGTQNRLDPQAVAEIRVHEPSLDAAVLADHERGRDRKQPAAIALKSFEIDAYGR